MTERRYFNHGNSKYRLDTMPDGIKHWYVRQFGRKWQHVPWSLVPAEVKQKLKLD